MTLAASLRNLIVHQYADLDLDRFAEALTRGLGDLEAFVGAIRGLTVRD